MSSASMETVLLWSCSCVTSNSIPQLLKNSTLARRSTRRCLVAYRRQFCGRTYRENHFTSIWIQKYYQALQESDRMDITVICHIKSCLIHF